MTDPSDPTGPTGADDARDGLDALGASTPPPPDAQFADRLEDRLRAVASTIDPAAGPVPAGPGFGRGRARRWATAGAVAASLSVGVLAGAMFADGDGDAAVTTVLASSGDAQINRVDGSVVDAVDGIQLRDGDIISTGPDGEIVIDGFRLGGDQAAIVVAGRLEPIDIPGPVTDDPSPTTTAKPSSGDPEPDPDRASPTTTMAPSPTTTARSDLPPDTKPAPTTTTTTTTKPRDVQRLRMIGAVSDGVVGLRWERAEGPVVRYVVARARGDAEMKPIGRQSDDRETRWFDRPGAGTWRYVVLGLDKTDQIIARTVVVTVDVPPAD